MTYWKMQLHPSGDCRDSFMLAIDALSKKLIGLDFRFDDDEGDLRLKHKDQIKDTTRKSYYAFCDEMQIDDHLLIVNHNYPLAICRVTSDYRYVTDSKVIGLWFRHFRSIDVLDYYRDYIPNPQNWEMIITTNAISPMRSKDTAESQLVTQWLEDLES